MKILYPLKGVEKFITQKYGENESYYKQFSIGGVPLKGHEGIDLRAPIDTEVLACDDGFCQEVIDQGKTGYGKYIKIIHSWGESVYAHLNEFKVEQGSQVKAGNLIGLADNTGNSSGSHLHFGIRINPYNRSDGWGGYSDPESLLFEEEEIMPIWAKNLQPFFSENNLNDDQIEGAVREAFGNSKILKGFIEKWTQKLTLTQGSDLSSIESEIQKLMDIEDNHVDLTSACQQIVGTFETEKALRDALRAVKTDIDEMAKTTKALIEENNTLKKKRTLGRYKGFELIKETLKEIFRKFFEYITKKTRG